MDDLSFASRGDEIFVGCMRLQTSAITDQADHGRRVFIGTWIMHIRRPTLAIRHQSLARSPFMSDV